MVEILLVSISILPAYFGGLLLSWAIEWQLQPRPAPPWRRPTAAIGVHVGVWTAALALELMLFQRPYFAMANVLALELIIILVSNTKFRMLREPFVYSDFEYFTDAIRHPRLYLPFLGLAPVVCLAIGYGIVLWAGLTLEKPVPGNVWIVLFCFAIAAVLGALVAHISARHIGELSFDASKDLGGLGLLPMLWGYGVAERKPVDHLLTSAPFFNRPEASRASRELPDLITIQSESFFDPRSAYPQIRQEILANFDILCSESKQYGSLAVSAWGANTVRTEFAYLTGFDAGEIGVHRYNPYRFLARQGVSTVASYLRSLGYRTICVHPYHAEFYNRDKILPALGFDEFFDINYFSDKDYFGPYVGDEAVGNYIQGLLQAYAGESPLYIHAITMENHGPLHWEKVPDCEAPSLFKSAIPLGCKDLAAYVRHLRNADRMFGHLRRSLLARDRRSGLCIFGDHVPIMPQVYDRMGEVDGSTSYLIWDSKSLSETLQSAINVNNIAETYLQHMGIAG